MANFEVFNREITECKCCLSEIDIINYVLYKDSSESKWLSCFYCCDCIQELLKTSWERYVKLIEKADCAAALKRLINIGPPINIRDPDGIPCDNESKEVYIFYFNDSEQSAKLVGSYVGEDRTKWWDELKETHKKFEEKEVIST